MPAERKPLNGEHKPDLKHDIKPYVRKQRKQRETYAKTQWTPAEEAIWTELVIKCLKTHLLAIVRADGRLKDRYSSMASHLAAMTKKMGGA